MSDRPVDDGTHCSEVSFDAAGHQPAGIVHDQNQAQMWRADARGLRLDREAFQEARAARRARRAAAKAPLNRRRLLAAAEEMDKAAFTRADLVELIGAQLPIDTDRSPRQLVEAAVDARGLRLSAPRAPHQREGHERFTLEAFLARSYCARNERIRRRAGDSLVWGVVVVATRL